MTAPTALLARTARRQHGLFTRSQLDDFGIPRSTLRALLEAGWCTKAARGVYRLEGAPRTRSQRMMAASLAHLPAAPISHRAAADQLGFPGFGSTGAEVLVVHGRNRRTELGLVHGTLLLPARHVVVRNDILVTTVARTLFDLAGVVAEQRAGAALDFAISRKLCTLRQVNQVFFVLAGQGRRGTVSMRSLLEERGEGYVPPATELERLGRRVFRDGGLPTPEFEVHLGDEDLIGRVDCFWREARLVVELDGARYHDGLSSREADRLRDNRLMAQGWRVLRFTWDDLTLAPARTIDLIRTALAATP